MTKKTPNGKIWLINYRIHNKNKAVKQRLEVNADCINLYIENKIFSAVCKKQEMDKMNISLTQATNYLIQLFYMTNKKYSCTRTKVGKLLSIVAFKYARKGMIAFEEKIYKYNDCGTAIQEIMERFKDRDIYKNFDYIYTLYPISDKELNTEVVVPSQYSDIESLNDDIKTSIVNVFVNFGAYPQKDLGEQIDIIVNQKDVTDDFGIINLEAIQRLKYSDFSSKLQNRLIKYIFEG